MNQELRGPSINITIYGEAGGLVSKQKHVNPCEGSRLRSPLPYMANTWITCNGSVTLIAIYGIIYPFVTFWTCDLVPEHTFLYYSHIRTKVYRKPTHAKNIFTLSLLLIFPRMVIIIIMWKILWIKFHLAGTTKYHGSER